MIFAPGALGQLGAAVRSLGCARALLITDPGLAHAGHPQRAADVLRAADVQVGVFDGVKENPSERTAPTAWSPSAAAARWTAPRGSTSC